MQARMKNPAAVIPKAMRAILALKSAAENGGVPPATLNLVHLHASQINGCSACLVFTPIHASNDSTFADRGLSHSPSFEKRPRPPWFFTATANARLSPISTTSRLPRVIPV